LKTRPDTTNVLAHSPSYGQGINEMADPVTLWPVPKYQDMSMFRQTDLIELFLFISMESAMAEATIHRVIEVIARRLYINPELITLDSSFDDMGVSSLRGLDVILHLEKEFSIEIPNEQAVLLREVRKIVETVENKLSGEWNQAESLVLVKL